ncbi:UNVERIFIED_CONTAM: hypothetical protein H355_012518 [Colinus virginianus]|nr:hypothetical protein H355_012518 [Colinus virginianus]
MWEDHPLSCSHPQVSPELLQPLVTVVATLGKLGPIPGDISLGGDVGLLRARLLTFSSGVHRAMMHPDGNATLLRCALGATKEQPGAPTAFTDSWRKAVTAVKDIWAKLQEDAARLRDACRTVTTARATTEASKGHLVEAVTWEDKALKGLMADTRVVVLPSEVTKVTEERWWQLMIRRWQRPGKRCRQPARTLRRWQQRWWQQWQPRRGDSMQQWPMGS